MGRSGPAGWKRALSGAIVASAVVVATIGVSIQPAAAADAIETGFGAPGPAGTNVQWKDGRQSGCSSGGTPTQDFTLVYPTNLGAGGTDHPVVVWGSGTDFLNTGNIVCAYEGLLRHWASWGFIVVAVNTGQAGTGTEMLDAADYIVSENSNPSSVFFQNVDTGRIAAAGHSQGAVGAVNATIDGDGMFESVLAMSIPNRDANDLYNLGLCFTLFGFDCVPVPQPPLSEMNDLDAPIFFARGTGLENDDPCELDDWMSNKTSHPEDGWYPTAAVPYADATAAVPPPQDPANCGGLNDWFPYPHMDLHEHVYGYTTAWLGYTLNGNALARAAFVPTGGSPAEIDNNTPKWTQVTLQNLP